MVFVGPNIAFAKTIAGGRCLITKGKQKIFLDFHHLFYQGKERKMGFNFGGFNKKHKFK
jgi:hypothetical protein